MMIKKKKMTMKRNLLMEVIITVVGKGKGVKIVMLKKIKRRKKKMQRRLLMMVMMMSWCYV